MFACWINFHILGSEISSEALLVAEEVCFAFKYFPFYFLVTVDGSSLTSSDRFEVRHPVVPSFDYYHVNEQSTQLSVYHLKQRFSTFKNHHQAKILVWNIKTDI